MKILREKRAITLVALIITIIILLILAGVSLSMIIGDNGLINKAKLAVNKYQESSNNEQKILNDYYSKIMIATNDSSQVTISVKALEDLIEEKVEQKEKETMLKMYPVGSIYTSISNNNPSTFIGGKWEQIQNGRCLMSTNDASKVGTYVEAGLPNITGAFSAYKNQSDGSLSRYTTSGAFYVQRLNGPAGYTTAYTSDGFDIACLDASRSNTIYGRSSTVQPPAYMVYMWKRVE